MTEPTGTPKKALLDQFARIGKAVASPARLEILDLLSQGEKPVDTIATQAGLSVTNTSNHLKELRNAALVTSRKDGVYVFYRLADPAVHKFLRCLQDIAARQLAEVRELVQDYFEAPDTLEPVEARELLERMRSDDVVVLDVRPEDEYAAGHIPGALSMPVAELERRLAELPTDREVIAYCRGPYCVFAVQAVDLLRAAGYRARRMQIGMPDWRARGLEVVESDAGGGGSAALEASP
jgi:rhodanese-related sulfurtransferase/DNA-binding transcriptional ArsR family regulator